MAVRSRAGTRAQAAVQTGQHNRIGIYPPGASKSARVVERPMAREVNLSVDFFARGVDLVARDLIGTTLLIGDAGGVIVETEAYSASDPASHSFTGMTPRNAVMFGPAARAYVYRIYGLHWCLNFTAGAGSAVLIRAIEPLIGLAHMTDRRGTADVRRLCAGPGRLCQALGVDGRLNGAPLDAPPFAISAAKNPPAIVIGTRVGITRAAETPWRFGMAGSAYLSKAIS